MTQYFDTPTSELRTDQIVATIWGREYSFTTANGVFSGSRLDPGTAVLFRETEPPDGSSNAGQRFLDLGCGYGPIAIALATRCPQAQVDAVDTNERALALARMNAQAHGVASRVRCFTPNEADAASGSYDQIWSNPPIRIGKEALHSLLLTWLARLDQAGSATLVISKNLGGDSLQSWLSDQGYPTIRLGSAKGFRVLRASPSR
jgi:16S rRNA G1207 methylase RsmC